MPAPTPLRAARAAVFAAVCVVLGLVGHSAVSGTVVPWWAPLGAVAVLTALTWAAAARERGLAVIGGMLVVVQAALHVLFAAVGGPGGGTPAVSTERQWLNLLLCNAPDHGMSAPDLLRGMGLDPALASQSPAAAGFGGTPSMPGMSMTSHAGWGTLLYCGGWGMLLAHLAAAAACAVWLRRGERALFRLLNLLARPAAALLALLRAWLGLGPPPSPFTGRAHWRPVVRATLHPVCRVLTRRGPPPAVAF